MEKLMYPGSLHNHTDYSNIRLRDCINKMDDLFNYAGTLGHKVVALTDHESISGWVKAEKTAKKLKEKYPELKVILGNEIYLCRNGLNANNYNREFDRYYHFVLLAKDADGAKQIREISTRAWMRSYMARGMRRVPTYYNDLFDAMDAMFSESEKYAVPQFPPCEVTKAKDGTVEISMSVAGYKKDDISISTDENKVIVSTVTDYKAPELPNGVSLVSANRIKRSAFKNSFVVPETKFNFNEIKAKFEDGILTITIPPKEKKEYKQIAID